MLLVLLWHIPTFKCFTTHHFSLISPPGHFTQMPISMWTTSCSVTCYPLHHLSRGLHSWVSSHPCIYLTLKDSVFSTLLFRVTQHGFRIWNGNFLQEPLLIQVSPFSPRWALLFINTQKHEKLTCPHCLDRHNLFLLSTVPLVPHSAQY